MTGVWSRAVRQNTRSLNRGRIDRTQRPNGCEEHRTREIKNDS